MVFAFILPALVSAMGAVGGFVTTTLPAWLGFGAAAAPAVGGAGGGVLGATALTAVESAIAAPIAGSGVLAPSFLPPAAAVADLGAVMAPTFGAAEAGVVAGGAGQTGISGGLAGMGKAMQMGTSALTGISSLVAAGQEPDMPTPVAPHDATKGRSRTLLAAKNAQGMGTTRLAPTTRQAARLGKPTVLGPSVA